MVAALRLDWTRVYDEDLVPRLVSWAIAFAIGAAWLLVVYLTPPTVLPVPTVSSTPMSVIDFNPGHATLTAPPSHGLEDHGAPMVTARHPLPSKLGIAEAFGLAITKPLVTRIASLIPGVATVQGNVGPETHGKAAVAVRGDGGTPGLSQLSGTAGNAAAVGAVQGGAPIGHTEVHVRPLPVVAAPAPGAALADATEMGSFVRTRVAQLESCYERAGGTDLGGVVALRLTIGDAGAVRSADIVRRTWSGPAAAATERCLLDLVKGWRIPSASAGATVTIPISFTRGT